MANCVLRKLFNFSLPIFLLNWLHVGQANCDEATVRNRNYPRNKTSFSTKDVFNFLFTAIKFEFVTFSQHLFFVRNVLNKLRMEGKCWPGRGPEKFLYWKGPSKEIIDHRNVKANEGPVEDNFFLLFVDDVIYRLNGNYGTLHNTSEAGQMEGGSMDSDFLCFSSIHEWHLRSLIEILHRVFCLGTIILWIIEMKVVMMGHETLLSLMQRIFKRRLFIPKQIFPFKSIRSEHVSHMQLKFVRPRHQMLEPKTWKRWRLWINLHSSFLVDGTASPMRSFTTFLSTSSCISNFHASCYAHLVSTIIKLGRSTSREAIKA